MDRHHLLAHIPYVLQGNGVMKSVWNVLYVIVCGDACRGGQTQKVCVVQNEAKQTAAKV